MDKYLLLVTSYPSIANPMAYAFVHSRIQQYAKAGVAIDVVKVANKDSREYIFEGIKVNVLSKESAKELIKSGKYRKILIHVLSESLIDLADGHRAIIWVHGAEVISWRRYLFENNSWNLRLILRNIKKRVLYRKFVKRNKENVSYVFVSEWMKKVAMKDLFVHFQHSIIIPNFIDKETFNYQTKDPQLRKKILVIRSFHSFKYAPDLIKKTVIALSQRDCFKDIEIRIIGDGKYFESEILPLSSYDNVTIDKHFLTHKEIASLHKQYGIFLCPTRMDAQGVSMCEAMSSGLVVVSSNNTAIPEFVDSYRSGMLCKNDKMLSFIEAIEELYYNPDLFLTISKTASNSIKQKCGYKETIQKEIDYILG